jgi:hypothetical protein
MMLPPPDKFERCLDIVYYGALVAMVAWVAVMLFL